MKIVAPSSGITCQTKATNRDTYEQQPALNMERWPSGIIRTLVSSKVASYLTASAETRSCGSIHLPIILLPYPKTCLLHRLMKQHSKSFKQCTHVHPHHRWPSKHLTEDSDAFSVPYRTRKRFMFAVLRQGKHLTSH